MALETSDIYIKHKGRCFYCNYAIPNGQASRDHVVPRILGGKRGENLVLACRSCNRFKGAKSKEEFLAGYWLASRRARVTRWESSHLERHGCSDLTLCKDYMNSKIVKAHPSSWRRGTHGATSRG